MEYILGGWQVGGILTLSTGIPTTPFIGGDPLGLINNDAQHYPDHIVGCDPVNHSYRNNVKEQQLHQPELLHSPGCPSFYRFKPGTLPYPLPTQPTPRIPAKISLAMPGGTV